MRRILSALIALSLGGSPLPSSAEDLLQIYDMAVVSDPTLREAEQTLFATREVKPQARSLLLPSLSLQGDAGFYDLDARGPSIGDRRDRYDTQEIQAVGCRTKGQNQRNIACTPTTPNAAAMVAPMGLASVCSQSVSARSRFDVGMTTARGRSVTPGTKDGSGTANPQTEQPPWRFQH